MAQRLLLSGGRRRLEAPIVRGACAVEPHVVCAIHGKCIAQREAWQALISTRDASVHV